MNKTEKEAEYQYHRYCNDRVLKDSLRRMNEAVKELERLVPRPVKH